MQSRAWLAVILLLPLSVNAIEGTTAASNVPTWSERVPLGFGDWVAFRANVTPDTDFGMITPWHGCHGGTNQSSTVIGAASFLIINGTPYAEGLTLDAASWGPTSDSAVVGVAGQRAFAPPGDGNGCLSTGGAYLAYVPGGASSVILIQVSMASNSEVNMRALWSKGVLSYDTFRGHGIIKLKEEFSSGVHATVYPALVGVAAGALSEDREQTSTPALGWFFPTEPGSGGKTNATCASEGGSCLSFSGTGPYLLTSQVPASWDFAVLSDVRTELPYFALGLLSLPNGTIHD